MLQKGGLLYYATITIAISVIGHNEVEVIHVYADLAAYLKLCTCVLSYYVCTMCNCFLRLSCRLTAVQVL